MVKIAIDWSKNGLNVCAINWGALSKHSYNYIVVAQINTRRVADYIVQLILFLENAGASISQMSAAGHSLGAQIFGKVGGALRKQKKLLKNIYGTSTPDFFLPYDFVIDESARSFRS